MNRRGFLGTIGALGTAIAAPSVVSVRAQTPSVAAIPIEPADGRRFVLGIATKTVHAGDFVQIQTYGPATVNVR
jgi:hypothetical protein